MRSSLSAFRSLFSKDLTLEVRGRETFVLLFGNIVTVSAIIGAGIASSFLDPRNTQRIFPTILWAVFFLTAAIGTARSNEHEAENRAFEGVALTAVSPVLMFLSKFLVQTLLLAFALLVTVVVTVILTGVPLPAATLVPLAIVGMLVVTGYAALSTLLVSVASASRVKAVLFPLLLLPLVFPIFFSAIELTASILETKTFEFSSPWLSLLAAADTVYAILGINLYAFVLHD